MSLSAAERIAALPTDERRAILGRLPEAELLALLADWKFWARPEQLPPFGAWTIWAVLAGRGFGKTRTGGEWVIDRAIEYDRPNSELRGIGSRLHRVCLVGRTVADVRDTMIEGESGLAAIAERRGIKLKYEPGRRRVTLAELSTVMHTFSAMEPDGLRGPQHHTAWADEPAAWRMIVDSQGNTAWTNLMLGLRLGNDPRVCATTTPKPVPLIKEWVQRAREDRGVRLTVGTLYDNLANLAATFVGEIVGRYRGTRLEGQEIMGLLLDAVEGASWKPDDILRVQRLPELARIMVGVDPPGETTTECGIVVAGVGRDHLPGVGAARFRRPFYCLDDMSVAGPPEVWGAQVVAAMHKWGANLAVVEKNHGGDMCRAVIHNADPSIPVKKVWASVGKTVRAEPVAHLYQQRRGFHLGMFPELESEMVTWVEGDPYSPNRMDALVWAATELLDLATSPSARSHAPSGRRVPTGAGAAVRRRP